MRRAQGTLIITDPYASAPIERDTFTCCHCNGIVVVPPPPAPMPGGYCGMCSKPVCEACVGHGCTPFEKKLEAMERRGRLLNAVTHG